MLIIKNVSYNNFSINQSKCVLSALNNLKFISKKCKEFSDKTSKHILNNNVRTPPIPLPLPLPSSLQEAQFVSPHPTRKNKIENI